MEEVKKTAGKKGEDNKGMVIGIGVGVVAIIAIVVVLMLTGVIGGGKHPSTPKEFVEAVRNREAVNCVISAEGESGAMTIQANDGWTKFRMFGEDGETSMSTLMLKDEGTFMTMGELAMKAEFDQAKLDEMIEDFSEDDEGDETAKVTCSSPSKNDFSIPDKDWMDMGDYE